MRFVAIALMVLALCGCKDKKKEPPPEAADTAEECEATADCDHGEICLAGKCAGTSQKTIITDPGNAVTPDKVKREIENINKAAGARSDKSLDL